MYNREYLESHLEQEAEILKGTREIVEELKLAKEIKEHGKALRKKKRSKRMNKESARENIKKLKEVVEQYNKMIAPPQKECSVYIGEDTLYLNDEMLESLDKVIECLEQRYQMNDKGEVIPIDNEWVDVRDRLPSDDEIAENYGEFEITYFDTIFKNQVTIAEFCKNNKYAIVEKDERGHWYDFEDDEIINVIAWKPLPQPYERKE